MAMFAVERSSKKLSSRKIRGLVPPRGQSFSGPEQCGGGGGGGSTAEEASVAAGSLGQGTPPKAITNVYAYDLDDGSVEMVMPASIVTEAPHWVQPSVFATPAT
uniref:Uncharacterized protein n=1 Tax=Setaria italica TaxID=4555 RepID=K3Y2K2_SETIT